jgi:hypothetical protein
VRYKMGRESPDQDRERSAQGCQRSGHLSRIGLMSHQKVERVAPPSITML